MNKLICAIACLTVAMSFAEPKHGGPKGPAPKHGPTMHHRPPAHAPKNHQHSNSGWGRGGQNFWPGFAGGFLGSVIANPPPPPPVYSQPVIVSAPVRVRVWIPEQRVIEYFDIFNRPVYRIIPGHYEWR